MDVLVERLGCNGKVMKMSNSDFSKAVADGVMEGLKEPMKRLEGTVDGILKKYEVLLAENTKLKNEISFYRGVLTELQSDESKSPEQVREIAKKALRA